MADELFSEGRLEDVFNERLKRAEAVVDELPEKSFKKPKKAVEQAISELIVEVPSLKRDEAKIDIAEGDPMTARLRLPFSGDAAMFGLRPTEYSLAPPQGMVHDDDKKPALEFAREFPVDTSPDDITAWATQAADAIDQYLYWQSADLGLHAIALEERVRALVDDRRARLESVSELQSEVDDIDDV